MGSGKAIDRLAGGILALGMALGSPAALAGTSVGVQTSSRDLARLPWGLALFIAVLVEVAEHASAAPETAHPVPAAAAEFMHFNPCPSTGATEGLCPGYVLVPIDPQRPVVASYDLVWEPEASARLRGLMPN